MARTSKTQEKKEITCSPVKPRFSKRLLEHANTKFDALKKTAIMLGIGVMVSCTPVTLNAQDTAKRDLKTPSASVAKERPKADDTMDNIEPLKTYLVQGSGLKEQQFFYTESFTIYPNKDRRGCDIEVFLKDESQPGINPNKMGKEVTRMVSSELLQNVEFAEVDMGKEGRLLLFAESKWLSIVHLKDGNTEVLNPISLRSRGLQEGKTYLAVVKQDDALLVFILPSKDGITLNPGDYFAKVMRKDGKFYDVIFEYIGKPTVLAKAGKAPDTQTIARR